MAVKISTATVTYEAGATTLRGYRAAPMNASSAPGVLVFHEWWGLNDYIRRRADMLAEAGYVAFAADMYGDGAVADNPDAAGKQMNAVLADIPTAEARLKAAYEQLQRDPAVDVRRIGAIGYCFGGAMVLHAARIGMPLAGVVSFHGALGSQYRPTPGSVRSRILVCHGGADKLVPESDVSAFEREMNEVGADFRVEVYDGALHGFTNPDATAKGQTFGFPLAYDAAADERSWSDMHTFLKETFA